MTIPVIINTNLRIFQYSCLLKSETNFINTKTTHTIRYVPPSVELELEHYPFQNSAQNNKGHINKRFNKKLLEN